MPTLEPRQYGHRDFSLALTPEAEWRWGWNCEFGPDCKCPFVSSQRDKMLLCIKGRTSKNFKWVNDISKSFRTVTLATAKGLGYEGKSHFIFIMVMVRSASLLILFIIPFFNFLKIIQKKTRISWFKDWWTTVMSTLILCINIRQVVEV